MQIVRLLNRGIKMAKLLSLVSLFCLLSTTVFAGQVVVRKSSEPFDAFAVRDEVKRKHQWREALRYQQQIQILQSLPIGCLVVTTPYRHFACQGLYYRPYDYHEQQVYIQIDPPN